MGARGGLVPGHVLVQTRQPGHLAVTAAVRGDPAALVAHEAQLAASLGAHGVGVTEDRGVYLAVADSHRELCDALAAVPRGSESVRVEVDPPGT